MKVGTSSGGRTRLILGPNALQARRKRKRHPPNIAHVRLAPRPMRGAPLIDRCSSHSGAGGAAGARAGFSSPALDIVSLAAKPCR
jgi:hypothetical protein